MIKAKVQERRAAVKKIVIAFRKADKAGWLKLSFAERRAKVQEELNKQQEAETDRELYSFD